MPSAYNWSNLSIDEIKRGYDKDGNRYWQSFLIDYKSVYPHSILTTNCGSCDHKIKNFIKIYNTMPVTWKIKEKYIPVYYPFGQPPITNASLTDEKAYELFKNHPLGAELFEVMPEKPRKKRSKNAKKEDNNEE